MSTSSSDAPQADAAAAGDVETAMPVPPSPSDDLRDAAWLRDALAAGIHRVIADRDHINRINVFPVADGDTGTNLAFTLHAVLQMLGGSCPDDVSELARGVADVALDSSRGNSGAIFAQFLQGFAEGMDDASQLDFRTYATAVGQGAGGAYGAIAEPREGTMLTVIQAYAEALDAESDGGFDDGMARGLEAAREALARTPEQLEVLRQNNVVDAGAQGFVDILEGMQAFVVEGSLAGLVREELGLADDDMAPAIEANESEHRFCTECMVTGDDIDRKRLREAIQDFGGSSLVIAGTKRKVRVHVHLDNPGALFLLCEDFGEVSSQKADDMEQQQRSARESRRKVAIVADTGADVPEAELERLQIHLVPLRINFDRRQYLDKVSLTPGEFYERLGGGDDLPRTSQPPPGDFRRQFEFLGSHFPGVICITLSGALSGTWQAASGAARRSRYEAVSVVDSKNASAGQGLLTMYAAEAALAGATHEQVLALLAEEIPRVKTFAILPTLAWAVRGGRLPSWVQRLAGLLRLTLVIGTDGQGRIRPRGAIFGRTDRPRRFARWLVRRAPDSRALRVLIAHCNNVTGARELRDELVTKLPRVHSVYLTDAGTALGAHAGPGTVIVSIQAYVPPEDRLEPTGDGGDR